MCGGEWNWQKLNSIWFDIIFKSLSKLRYKHDIVLLLFTNCAMLAWYRMITFPSRQVDALQSRLNVSNADLPGSDPYEELQCVVCQITFLAGDHGVDNMSLYCHTCNEIALMPIDKNGNFYLVK